MIGIYGWMHSPCIEWYINEDSYNSLAEGQRHRHDRRGDVLPADEPDDRNGRRQCLRIRSYRRLD